MAVSNSKTTTPNDTCFFDCEQVTNPDRIRAEAVTAHQRQTIINGNLWTANATVTDEPAGYAASGAENKFHHEQYVIAESHQSRNNRSSGNRLPQFANPPRSPDSDTQNHTPPSVDNTSLSFWFDDVLYKDLTSNPFYDIDFIQQAENKTKSDASSEEHSLSGASNLPFRDGKTVARLTPDSGTVPDFPDFLPDAPAAARKHEISGSEVRSYDRYQNQPVADIYFVPAEIINNLSLFEAQDTNHSESVPTEKQKHCPVPKEKQKHCQEKPHLRTFPNTGVSASEADSSGRKKNYFKHSRVKSERLHTASPATRQKVKPQGITELHDAVFNREYQKVLRYLTSHKKRGQINQPNLFGYYPIHTAAKFGLTSILKALVTYGAGLETVTADKKKETPLHIAMNFSTENMVKTLGALGADFHAKNTEGFSPIECAIMKGKITLVKTALESGAEPFKPGYRGKTLLMFATKRRIKSKTEKAAGIEELIKSYFIAARKD